MNVKKVFQKNIKINLQIIKIIYFCKIKSFFYIKFQKKLITFMLDLNTDCILQLLVEYYNRF